MAILGDVRAVPPLQTELTEHGPSVRAERDTYVLPECSEIKRGTRIGWNNMPERSH